MGRRAFLVLGWTMAIALASPARAQVGDPPPPPAPLEDVELPPVELPVDPADEGSDPLPPAPPPPPPPTTPSEPAAPRFPMPPPDVTLSTEACPSAPAWPLAGAAAGLAGGLTFAAAAGGLLALSWASTTSGVSNGLVPVALLLGSTTLPFLAGLGAGAAMLPLGKPLLPTHFLELCGVCAASWALSLCIVGAAVGGGSLGCGSPSCGSCNDPFGFEDEEGFRGRPDVYWAATGAGLGAIAGAAVTWVATSGLTSPSTDADVDLVTLGQVVGGAALGSLVLGALGGAYGALEYEEELATTGPTRCRER